MKNLNLILPGLNQRELFVIRSVFDLGQAVRIARKEMGMNQQEFAGLAGVGRRFISELERGKATLEIDRVVKVCNAAGIDLLASSR